MKKQNLFSTNKTSIFAKGLIEKGTFKKKFVNLIDNLNFKNYI